MKTHKTLSLIASVGIAAAALTGCSSHSDSASHSTPSASIPASLPAGWTAEDIMFAQMMIPHHQQAVDAANVVLANPNASERLQEHAKEVIAAQQAEIDLMTGWLDAAGAEPLPMDQHAGDAHAGHGMDAMNNEALAAATDPLELDNEWATQMIPHHDGAILMAEDVLATTKNPDVKKLADEIINAQDSEIEMLETWLLATPAATP